MTAAVCPQDMDRPRPRTGGHRQAADQDRRQAIGRLQAMNGPQSIGRPQEHGSDRPLLGDQLDQELDHREDP